MSTPAASTAVTTDNPWIDCERTTAMPCTPLIASSNGLVTSSSTCSGESPGASVWMETCSRANSGKTSSRARARVLAPTSTSAAARPSTTPRCRIEPRTSPLSIRGPLGSLARLVAHGHAGAKLLGEQLLGAGHHDRVAGVERRPGDPAFRRWVVGGHGDTEILARRALQVDPGEAVPLHHGTIGHQNAGH